MTPAHNSDGSHGSSERRLWACGLVFDMAASLACA
jgi:hypothetical protein